MSQLESHPVSSIQGEYIPPGDKSISHRVVMLGSLAEGTSRFTHFLNSDDCQRTMSAFREMGIKFEPGLNDEIVVHGRGLLGLSAPKGELYLGNSGTTMRLLLGILAGQDFEVKLTGDPSLSSRPMKRVTDPLRQMGAQISGGDDANFAPLTIRGGKLKGIQFQNKLASAQVKSAVLLAGLYAQGETTVSESLISRDHTERLLQAFGASFKKSNRTLTVQKTEKLKSISFDVPGDISSAAFFIAAALIVPGSKLLVKNVGLNPTRIGFLEAIKQMGADVTIMEKKNQPEPVGEILIKCSRLKAVNIDWKWIPSLIDELPILMILCAFAEGTSVISGAKELRVKETDRIKSMAEGLRAVGGKIEEREDGCVIQGVKKMTGGTIQSFGDHRTAMSFLIAGLKSEKGIVAQDIDCLQTSYPNFINDLKRIST